MQFSVPPQLAALWKDEKRRTALLAVLGIAGMLLIALPEFLPDPPQQTPRATAPPAPTTACAYAAELETRLEELLCQVEGAGSVSVMVTLAAGEETVYAQDRQTAADGSGEQTHVLLQNAESPALVETVTMPSVQGVAVVCEGGGDAAVQGRITQIVAALTGIGASRITVTRMVTTN